MLYSSILICDFLQLYKVFLDFNVIVSSMSNTWMIHCGWVWIQSVGRITVIESVNTLSLVLSVLTNLVLKFSRIGICHIFACHNSSWLFSIWGTSQDLRIVAVHLLILLDHMMLSVRFWYRYASLLLLCLIVLCKARHVCVVISNVTIVQGWVCVKIVAQVYSITRAFLP